MGTYFYSEKEKRIFIFFNRKNVLALSVTWLKNKKKKRRGKKKLLCAVNIEQQPSPDDVTASISLQNAFC